eukprot:m.173607 g.173607  ORF g.173607 m.173607 type:complete len:972 (+) comp31735_c0_seq2:100-3015(+)
MPKRKGKGTGFTGGKSKDPDFERKKKKVGKVTTRANQTKVDLRSRQINIREQLSTQSSEANAASITNERGLGLAELLVRVAHHNANTRKDSINGLRSLFQQHPTLLSHTTTLMRLFEKIAPRMGDSEASVRGALILLLRSVISGVSPECIGPFFPLLMVHTCSAMTKMEGDVRADSLQLLDLWFEYLPKLSVRHGTKMLENLLQLISSRKSDSKTIRGSSGSAGGSGNGGVGVTMGIEMHRSLLISPVSSLNTLKSRMAVLRRLHVYMELLFQYGSDEGKMESIRTESVTQQQQPMRLSTISFSTQAHTGANDQHKQQPPPFRELVMQDVLPVVLQCWAEHNPAGLSMDSSDRLSTSDLANMRVLTDISNLVVKRLMAIETEDTCREQLLHVFSRTFMVHFPLTSSIGDDNSESAGVLTSMNLALAETMVSLLPPGSNTSNHTWIERVLNYLQNFVSETDKQRKLLKSLIRQGSSYFPSFVRLCQTLLQKLPVQSIPLYEAMFDLYSDSKFCHSQSAQKKALVNFFADQLIKGHTHYDVLTMALINTTQRRWLTTLPRLLWELKHSSPETTGTILQVLTVIGSQRLLCDDERTPLLTKMQTEIARLFYVHISHQHVFGPFISFSKELRVASIDLVYYVETIAPETYTALAMYSYLATSDPHTVAHMLRVMTMRILDNNNNSINNNHNNNNDDGDDGDNDNDDKELKADVVVAEAANFLSFMLTIVVGYRKELLDQLQVEREGDDLIKPSTQAVRGRDIVTTSVKPKDDEERVANFWRHRLIVWEEARVCIQRLKMGTSVYQLLRDPLELVLSLGPTDALISTLSLLSTSKSLEARDYLARVAAIAGPAIISSRAQARASVAWNDIANYVVSQCVACIVEDNGLLSSLLERLQSRLASTSSTGIADAHLNFVYDLLVEPTKQIPSSLWKSNITVLQKVLVAAKDCERCSSVTIQRLASQMLLTTNTTSATAD